MLLIIHFVSILFDLRMITIAFSTKHSHSDGDLENKEGTDESCPRIRDESLLGSSSSFSHLLLLLGV